LCDLCASPIPSVSVMELVTTARISCLMCRCEGSKNAKVIDSGHDRCSMYDGSSKFGLDRTDSERLFRQLVIHGVLDEELYVTAQDHTVCYIRLGMRANDLLNGKFKVMSDVVLRYTTESFTAAMLLSFCV